MNTYTFVLPNGLLVFIEADSYEEACALYWERVDES